MKVEEIFVEKVNRNPVWRAFLRVESFIVVLTSILSIGLICFNVFTRYIVHRNFFGMDDLLLVVMVWMYFMGGAYGSYEESHITADVVGSFVSHPLTKKILSLIQNGVSVLVCGMFTVWLWEYIVWNIQAGSISPVLKMPNWCAQGSLGLGFTLMLIYHIYHCIRAVLGIVDITKLERRES